MKPDNEQIADQYRVVAYLARALADVHADLEPCIRANVAPDIHYIQGERSAYIMEILGDILNGMDATDEADRWCDPIFDEAQRRWPNVRNRWDGPAQGIEAASAGETQSGSTGTAKARSAQADAPTPSDPSTPTRDKTQ